MDIESLLTEISPENPCGENCEYDTDFMALEKASEGKAEQQFGDTIISAESPDWGFVIKTTESLLSKSKDLRVMMYLTQGWTETNGINGYLDGLTLIDQSLERYWIPLHPQLEFEGEYDPLFRVNTLSRLSDIGEIISSLRSSTMLKDLAGEITVRDACALLDGSKQECSGYPGGKNRLINELNTKAKNITEQFLQAHKILLSIQDKFQNHLGDMVLPDFNLTLKTLNMIASVNVGNSVEEASLTNRDSNPGGLATVSQSSTISATTQQEVQNWRQVDIQSRDDAILMLDKVKSYFTRFEPSHPAPLMINRVQKLASMDFMQIIQNLAPEGVSQLETIFGQADNEYEQSTTD